MSSLLCSHGVVLVTAMAVSSTIIFLALRRQKRFCPTQFAVGRNSSSILQTLPSCISSEEKKRERLKKKKRVQFADDVTKAGGDCSVFVSEVNIASDFKHGARKPPRKKCQIRKMPANQLALYRGILRDRPPRMA